MTQSIIAQPSLEAPAGTFDVAIVGGGAAGMAAAIFTARSLRLHASKELPRMVILDGARTLGAKILVSGGSRCNVTNASVAEGDFWRAGSSFVRQVLRALPVREAVHFFEEIGVRLKEEPLGKLFPVTNKSRTVLDALLREAARLNVEIRTSCRVEGVNHDEPGWTLATSQGIVRARSVVLATGGLSLPKSGSDGLGLDLARGVGHTIVPTVPALEPLILGGHFHSPLSGIAHDASIRVTRPGEKPTEIRGSLLWTHFGISGPLALDVSRFFRRAKAEGTAATLSLSFVPGRAREEVEEHLVHATRERPQTNLTTELTRVFGLAQAVSLRIVTVSLGRDEPLAKLTREKRRDLVRSLTAFPLDVTDGRGYNYAEVTSGGVSLDEVNPKTMESRVARGLFFVGEILDVDGRIGGFNFQWAWSTGKVAGVAIAKRLRDGVASSRRKPTGSSQ